MPTLVKLSENRLGPKTITENGTYLSTDDNLDGYAEVNVNVAGGGGAAATEFEVAMADLNPVLTEIEGMPCSLLVDQVPLPEFLKSAPGRITLITDSVETEMEFDEGTLEDMGASISTPMYMFADEARTPAGNPYMYAIMLAPGASVTSFNPAEGECVATEDPDTLSILGYCIEMDAEGTPIQPNWYIDSLKVYAPTAEDIMEKRDIAWIKGSFDAPFKIPEDVSYCREYCFAGVTFKGTFTVSKKPEYTAEGAFMRATFRGGLYFEEGGTWRLHSKAFKNVRANDVETPIQVLTVPETYTSLSDSVFEFADMPYVRVNMPNIENISANALYGADLYSINSDEQGTFYLGSTSTADVSGYISEGALSYVHAKKLILDYPNYDLNSSYQLWTGFWGSLEELRINVSPSSIGTLILGASSDTSSSAPIKVVCPNIVFSHTEGVFASGSGTTFLHRITYFDCKSPWIYTYTPSNSTFPSYAKTLVFRETRGIIKGLENVWHYELESLYVPDELLASYQEYYTNCEDTLGVRAMLLAALKPLSEFPGE